MPGSELDELLAACADEPIHVPEAVQPFGALVAIEAAREAAHGVVRVRSTRAEGLLAGVRLGASSAALADAELIARALTASGPVDGLLADGRRVDLVAHRSGALVVVDVEEVRDGPLGSDELIARSRPLWQARSLAQLLDRLVVEVRALTGFDRVMAYRFDDEWNGEVVAESCASALDPYLGLRFPASDIPAQARELYQRNPARLIADVDYVPDPLEHEDPSLSSPLDLSDSGVRSVSPVHLQYLRNMGVAASMSLSLLVEGRLWGLVACHHHDGPRRPDPAHRRAATALAELTSALVVTVTEAEVLAERVVAAERLGALRSRVEAADDPAAALVADHAVLDVVDAVGAVVCIDGHVVGVGEVPPVEQAAADAAALLTDDGLGATDRLPGASGGLVGCLTVPLTGGRSNWIAWYRPEIVREIRWAGDPRSDERMVGADGRTALGPRRSFATFVESVTGRSRPWGTGERWAATELSGLVAAAVAHRTRARLATTNVVQRALLLDGVVHATGFDVAVRYEPADGDPIGGDWHDVFHLPDGSAAFVVGDTVGHGVEVAGVMGQLRHALRAYLVADPDPADALRRADDLVQQLLPGQLATSVVVVVEPRSGALRCASAGHLPPFLLRPDGAELLAVRPAPALGLGRAAMPAFDAVLSGGEGLLLFSDGLVERRGTAPLESLRQLGEAVGGTVGGAAAICDRAVVAAGPTDDDLTVLAFLRDGVGRGIGVMPSTDSEEGAP